MRNLKRHTANFNELDVEGGASFGFLASNFRFDFSFDFGLGLGFALLELLFFGFAFALF